MAYGASFHRPRREDAEVLGGQAVPSSQDGFLLCKEPLEHALLLSSLPASKNRILVLLLKLDGRITLSSPTGAAGKV